MSISTFARGRSDEGSPPSASPSGNSANLTAFIDQGSDFEGKLSFKDTVRIDGGFKGEITSENTLIVGETGEVTANIQSSVVVVSGTVVGNIHAKAKVILHKTGVIEGDVESPSLVIEDGGRLNGSVRMGMSPSSAKVGQPTPTKPLSTVGGKPGASSAPEP